MKKILIVLFIAVIACFLAFTVSAANEVTLADGTNADLEVVFNVSGEKICVLVEIEESPRGFYYIVKSE